MTLKNRLIQIAFSTMMLFAGAALADNPECIKAGGKAIAYDEESFRSMQKDTPEWAAACRWPDLPPPGSPPGAIGGFGAPPITTTGGPYIAPTSPSDDELLQELNRRAEQVRNQMRAHGQLSGQ